MAFTPVFIIGVPRSGTTLLRVLLDSHSQVAALPESPWLLGAYGPDTSVRSLLEDLTDGPYGIARNVSGVRPDHILAAGRRFLDEMFEPFLERQDKRMLVFKTPHDIRHLEFLMRFLPDARYIHITRDGRDVCLSQLEKKGAFFKDLREFGRLSYANTFRRWVEWELHVRAVLHRPGVPVLHMRYEDLIADPDATLRRITAFLEMPFEAAMLDYASVAHDYPAWEAGSTDVAQKDGISAASIGRWRRARMTTEMLYTLQKYDAFLTELGYAASDISPGISERWRMALFPVTRPIVELAHRTWRGWQQMARSRIETIARGIALATALLLVGHFLLPFSVLHKARLALSDAYESIACFLVVMSLIVAFGPPLARLRNGPHAYERSALSLAVVVLICVGLLELAQNFVQGRHAAVMDFLLNGSGVLLGAGLIVTVGRRAKGRLVKIIKGRRPA